MWISDFLFFFIGRQSTMKINNILKKLTVLALAATFAFSVTACSSSSSSENSESGENSAQSSASEESTDSTASSETTETSTAPIDGSSMPDPTAGDEAFKSLFSENAIDSDYLSEINSAQDVVSSVRAGNSAATRWKSQIEISLDELKELDSSAYDEQASAQETWENGLDAAVENVKSNITTDGSLGNIEAAYNVMLLYRERAAEVLYQIYQINGEVNVSAGVGEAQG